MFAILRDFLSVPVADFLNCLVEFVVRQIKKFTEVLCVPFRAIDFLAITLFTRFFYRLRLA